MQNHIRVSPRPLRFLRPPFLRSAFLAAACFAGLALAAPSASQAGPANGVVHVKSAYPMAQTIERLKADIAAKKIRFFAEIDQASLAKAAGIDFVPRRF